MGAARHARQRGFAASRNSTSCDADILKLLGIERQKRAARLAAPNPQAKQVICPVMEATYSSRARAGARGECRSAPSGGSHRLA